MPVTSRKLVPVLAVCLLCLLVLKVAPASAAGFRRIGLAPPRPAAARVDGPPAADAPLSLTVALTPRDPSALAAYAAAVSNPRSADFHRYLTVAQFASRFGARPAAIHAVASALRRRGLSVGRLAPDGLALTVHTSAAGAAHAFATHLERLTVHGRHSFANTSAPELPASVAADVQAVLGLSTLPHAVPLLAGSVHSASGRAVASAGDGMSRAGAARAAEVGGTYTGTPCAEASSAAAQQNAYSPAQLAGAYDFTSIWQAGDLGAGQTVALYELESNEPSDITTFESCFGATGNVSYEAIDGGAGPVDVSNGDGAETALDADNVLSLAPRANLLVYQGPNTDQGALDTLRAIVDDNRAKVISTSWGECEPDLGVSAAQAEATLFEQAAVQGQSVVAASGDNGAEGCQSTDGTDEAAVDDPASQPEVTGVGGTSLMSPAPGQETVWNEPDSGPQSQDSAAGASGGGISALWPMPAYQSETPTWLGLIGADSSGAPCGVRSGTYCREVPDVAASADPREGYTMFWAGTWLSAGGTSGAAPVWAALLALADASSACASAPVGDADPALYGAASADYSAFFHDVTSGDNDWTGTNAGAFAAGPGYDEATGLGTPDAASLLPELCGRQTLTLTDPGAQRSPAGRALSLQVHVSDAAGQAVTLSATGLPPGLSLTGAEKISGTPTTIGSYSVLLQARDTRGLRYARTFTWTITQAPSPASKTSERIVLTRPAPKRVRVGRRASLQVHAHLVPASPAPLRYRVTGLPPGLRLNAHTGRITGVPRRAGRYNVVVVVTGGGARTSSARFRWTIAR